MLSYCSVLEISLQLSSLPAKEFILEVGNREIKTAKCLILKKNVKFSSAKFSRYTVIADARVH